jgi:gamma-glutamylcyclotransferase (GGCT)/AIG2-like uncharacterized protein YtfP
MDNHLVFVYGSLRSGNAHSMSQRFPDSKFVAAAKVSGRLYDLGEYPGLLLSETDSTVVGEVYEVDDVLLQELDEFEASSNYLRRQVTISLADQTKTGWAYEPDLQFYSLGRLIESGDWLEYAKTKRD